MKPLSRRTEILIATLVVLGAYVWAFLALMERRQRDISWFVVAGEFGVDAARLPPGLSVIPGVAGYDGVAFYRLAVDPVTRKKIDYGISLDNPPYRHQRIAYPLIVHILSLGNVVWIPTLLVIVNVAAVVLLTIGACSLAAEYGLRPFWGAVIPLYAGFFIAFSRNTSEVVAWAFAIWAIREFTVRRWRSAVAFLCAAILARETTLVVAIALAAVYIGRMIFGRERLFPAATFVVPTALYVTWQMVLRIWWGESGIEAGTPDLVVPFSGYLRVLMESSPRRSVFMRIHFAECLVWAGVTCAVVAELIRRRTPPQWTLAWAAYLAIGATLASNVWSEHISFMRVLGDLFAMSSIVLFRAGPVSRSIVLVATCMLSHYVMSHMR